MVFLPYSCNSSFTYSKWIYYLVVKYENNGWSIVLCGWFIMLSWMKMYVKQIYTMCCIPIWFVIASSFNRSFYINFQCQIPSRILVKCLLEVHTNCHVYCINQHGFFFEGLPVMLGSILNTIKRAYVII